MCWVVLLLSKISVADLHLSRRSCQGERTPGVRRMCLVPFSLLPLFSEGSLDMCIGNEMEIYTFTHQKGPGLPSVTENKEYILKEIEASCCFVPSCHLCLPFWSFPYSMWSWWSGHPCNPLFPKSRMSPWHAQGVVGWEFTFPDLSCLHS